MRLTVSWLKFETVWNVNLLKNAEVCERTTKCEYLCRRVICIVTTSLYWRETVGTEVGRFAYFWSAINLYNH